MKTILYIRVLLLSAAFVWSAAGYVHAQSEFRYYLFDETKTDKLHYDHVHDFTVYHYEKGKPTLCFNTEYRIYGVCVSNFTYTTESCSYYPIPLGEHRNLLNDIKGIPLTQLKTPTAGQTSNVLGWVEIEGTNLEVHASLSDENRRRLHDLLLAFLERVVPKSERKTEVRTFEGDMMPPRQVTLTEIVKDPMRYDGRRVRLKGFHHGGFEHSSLSSGPKAVNNYKESLWLGRPSTFAKKAEVVSMNDVFMTVEGTLEVGPSGHMGLWPAELARITRIEIQKDADPTRKSTVP